MIAFLFVFQILLWTPGMAQNKCNEGGNLKIQSITPIHTVDQIEPTLDFWEGKLGFRRTAEVPHGGGLGFVMLEKDGSQMMLQTFASVADDMPSIMNRVKGSATVLYVVVDSLDSALKCLDGMEFIVPPRETFYGAREVVVASPSGHLTVFAERLAQND